MNLYEGDTVELDKVLLIADDDKVTIGNPTVDGARVTATCQGEKRSAKTIVLHYKPKRRYHKKNGHRQSYTRLVIDDIISPGSAEEAAARKPRRRKKEVTEEVTEDGA
jgi:large subunit ribosomal protein L21